MQNASVWAVAADIDNRVYTIGNFSSVDGVDTPGVVRLLPDGGVDTGFQPQVAAPRFFVIGNRYAIQPLPDGSVLIGKNIPRLHHEPGQQTIEWAVLDPNGNIVADALRDVPTDAAVMPQFVKDGTLMIIEGARNPEGTAVHIARRVFLESGRYDSDFEFTRSEFPPAQMIPSADGGVWLLEGSPGYDSFLPMGEFQLRKLDSNGREVRSPRTIVTRGSAGFFETGNDGSFAISKTESPSIFSPAPLRPTYTMDFFSADGDEVSSVHLAGEPPFLPDSGGAVILRERESLRLDDRYPDRRTRRRQLPDGSEDPSFKTLFSPGVCFGSQTTAFSWVPATACFLTENPTQHGHHRKFSDPARWLSYGTARAARSMVQERSSKLMAPPVPASHSGCRTDRWIERLDRKLLVVASRIWFRWPTGAS